MDLRLAERQKWIPSLSQRSFATHLRSVRVSGAGFDGTVQLAPGLSVVAGGNGSGKSRLLGAIWRCLGGPPPGDGPLAAAPPVGAWITALEVNGTSDGVNWAADPTHPCPCPVVYIDAAAETERLLRLLADDDSPGDFTDGISPTPFDKEDVALLSFLLRRDYTEFNTYEISSFSPADEVIPFFQVVSSRATYGPLEMGRGELCAAYLVWRLRRLSRGSIVLLEEPEAHLASHSQHVLAQALARYASALDLAIVASSHSPGFFLQLPRGAVVLVTTNGRLDVRGELWGNQLADYFGVPGSATLMAVTEDRFAASMGRALLAHLDPDLAAQLSIWHTKNGESAVRKVADELQAPRVPGRDRLIVILDGDTRLGTEPAGHYLPGTSAPEIVTLEILKNWHRDRTWIPDLPGSSDALSLALDRVLGMDHHDALEHLAATFGGLDTLMTGLIPGLLADEDFAKDAVELVANLRASAGLV